MPGTFVLLRCLLGATGMLWAGFVLAVPPTRPNVLFMLVDDMGYNDVEYHNGGSGPGWTKTPHINRLAARGVRLDHHYANPICSPTRATIQTGRYTIRTGIQHACYSNSMGTGLPLSERTLGQALQSAGYETWALGKWHLGFNTEAFLPTSRGYHYHYGHYNAAVEAYNHTVGASGTAAPRFGLDWHRNNVAMDGEGVTGAHTCQLLTTDLVAKLHSRATSMSAGASDKPLFVYMAWHMIHEADGMAAPPWSVSDPAKPTKLVEAPPAYSAPYAANATDLSRQVFLGMVSLVDEAVGNATEAWEAVGLQENGLMIMTSDNGSPPDQRGLDGNLPFRGFKHQLWEGGLRVPTYVVGVGIPSAQIRTEITAQIDWFPTLVKLAGGDPAAGKPLDGLDIWPVIVEGAHSPHHELLHNYDTSLKPTAGFRGALRQGDMKLIIFGSNNSAQLFNISADQTETTDLTSALPAIAQQMRARLEQLGHEAVPCWGGTGSAPNPVGFRGDCDHHPKAMNCTESVPAVYQPGWCITPPSPVSPPPPPPPLPSPMACQAPKSGYCCHRDRACDAKPSTTDPRFIYAGNETNPAACEALCTQHEDCNCLSFTTQDPEGKASSTCKLFRAITELKNQPRREACVRGS